MYIIKYNTYIHTYIHVYIHIQQVKLMAFQKNKKIINKNFSFLKKFKKQKQI